MEGWQAFISRAMRPRFNILLKPPSDEENEEQDKSPLKGGLEQKDKEAPDGNLTLDTRQVEIQDKVDEELADFVRQYPRVNPLLYATLFSLFAAMGGFLGGYDTGIISGAMVYIRDDFKFNDLQTETTVSGVVAGAIFGSLMSGNLSDAYGRKFVSILSAFTYMLGGIMMSTAQGFASLLIGRLVTGVAVGCGSIAPVYIGEVVPSENRGAFVNSNAFLIAIGQLISYLTAYALSGKVEYGKHDPVSGGGAQIPSNPHEKGNWRLMLGLTIIPPLLQILVMPLMPQSPRFLNSKGRIKDAAKSLLLVYPTNRGRDEIINRVRTIQRGTAKSKDAEGRQLSYLELLTNGEYRRLVLITSGLQALQQLSGINTIMYYSAFVLRMAGFPSKSSSILFSTLIGLANSVGSLVSMYTINRFKRRQMLLITLAGVFFGLLNLSITFGKYDPIASEAVSPPGRPSKSSYIALSSVIVYVIFYSLGLGCVPWNIVAEIFPMEARSRGAAFAIATNWIGNFAVSLTFLSLTRLVTASGTFAIYATFVLIGWVLTYAYVPETKGKSLESDIKDIDDQEFSMITPH